jgi:hypothetical protein
LRSRLIAYRGTRIENRLERDSLVISKGILGTQWRFRNLEVARIYQRFENLLRAEIFDLELKLYHYQRSLIRANSSSPKSGDLENLLKECWLALFRLALDNHDHANNLKRKLQQLRENVEEFCEEK